MKSLTRILEAGYQGLRWVAGSALAVGVSVQAAERGAVAHRDTPTALFRGTLTQQEDRLLLSPCGGGRAIRVRDVSPEVMITAAITDIGFDRVKRLHFEAYGRMQDGELMVQQLNRAGVEMGCPKARIGLRAQGNEPGWRLDSSRAGVTWIRQGEVTLHAPARALAWQWSQGDQHRPHATLGVATQTLALNAVLTQKICRDTMADAVFGFTAHVQQLRPEPAREYSGCAYLDRERLP